jgi:hypothetical protein
LPVLGFARLNSLAICTASPSITAPSKSSASSARLARLIDEIYNIGDQVWASPVQGWTDLLERALVTHYWFRDEETKSPDIVAARGLVSAVLAYNLGA